jgi:hypothetical protein
MTSAQKVAYARQRISDDLARAYDTSGNGHRLRR